MNIVITQHNLFSSKFFLDAQFIMNLRTKMNPFVCEVRWLVIMMGHVICVNVISYVTDSYGTGVGSTMLSGAWGTAMSFLLWLVMVWAQVTAEAEKSKQDNRIVERHVTRVICGQVSQAVATTQTPVVVVAHASGQTDVDTAHVSEQTEFPTTTRDTQTLGVYLMSDRDTAHFLAVDPAATVSVIHSTDPVRGMPIVYPRGTLVNVEHPQPQLCVPVAEHGTDRALAVGGARPRTTSQTANKHQRAAHGRSFRPITSQRPGHLEIIYENIPSVDQEARELSGRGGGEGLDKIIDRVKGTDYYEHVV